MRRESPGRGRASIGIRLGVQSAMLDLEMRRQSLAVGGDRGAKGLDVVGMNTVEPFLGKGADLIVAPAEHFLPARREINLSRAKVPVPEPVIGAAHGKGESLLAFAEGFFGLF